MFQHARQWHYWNPFVPGIDMNGGMYVHAATAAAAATGMTPQNGISFHRAVMPIPSRRYHPMLIGSLLPDIRQQHGGGPWRTLGKNYAGLEGLTEDINDFYAYARPNAVDQELRDQVIEKVCAAIREYWPHCVVEVFGSYKTGLYLPTGDIDMVIRGNWEVIPPLFDLERQLIDKNIGEKATFKVLDKASVPLIKFTDATTGIRVDLSFNQANCTEAAAFVKQCCKVFPPLPKLIFVLKQFLNARCLNEVFHGGISSYSLTLLILSFLQLHPKTEMVRSENAETGKLLVEFLEFYGERFDYDKTGIRIKDGGCVMPKAELRESIISAGGPPTTASNLLCIEDPLTPGNDVARSSYAMSKVRDAFKSAFKHLQNADHLTLFGVVGDPRQPFPGPTYAMPTNGSYSTQFIATLPEVVGHRAPALTTASQAGTRGSTNRGTASHHSTDSNNNITGTDYTNNNNTNSCTGRHQQQLHGSSKKRPRKWSDSEPKERNARSSPPPPGRSGERTRSESFDLIINGPESRVRGRSCRVPVVAALPALFT